MRAPDFLGEAWRRGCRAEHTCPEPGTRQCAATPAWGIVHKALMLPCGEPCPCSKPLEAKPLAGAWTWTELPSFYHSFIHFFSCRINRVFLPSGLRVLQLLLLWALWHQLELHFLGAATSRRCRKGVWDVSLESSREKGPGPAPCLV